MIEKVLKEIKRIAYTGGIDLVGIANLSSLQGIQTCPSNLLEPFKYGICLAVSLDKFSSTIFDNTTEDLACEILEKTAKRIKGFIRKKGYKAKIIPFDERVKDFGPLYYKGAISHKAIAKAAGLGWIGKSTLLITPQYGPRVNLISILTDMPLRCGKPMKNRCGNCSACIEACPVGALKDSNFLEHPEKLEDCIDVFKCGPYVDKTWEKGKNLLGMCSSLSLWKKTKNPISFKSRIQITMELHLPS